MFNRLTAILVIGLVLAGLTSGPLSLYVRFDDVSGLLKNDRVVFDGTHVGKVQGIVYGDDGIYTVSLVIDRDFKDILTEFARFAVAADPHHDNRMAVEVILTRTGGTPLQDGSTLKGADKYRVLLEMMRDDAKDGIVFLKKEYRRFSDELQSLSEHEKVRKLKEAIAKLAKELKKESRQTRDKIVTEIVPMLEQEIQTLREQLEALGRGEEAEPLEEEFEKIKNI